MFFMKYLSYGVMIYMLLALIWWTILLFRNNELLYEKSKLVLDREIMIGNEEKSAKNDDLQMIEKNYTKNKFMILGEGFVFGLSLIIGIWFIQKSYTKELENNRKQKNFLLSVTHELKSPITSINLITETLLKRKLPEPTSIELQKNILSESKRLENLINNLLLTTKLNGTYQYNFETIDLIPLLENIIDHYKLQFPTANIQLLVIKDNIKIYADQEALISVFNNLIENGIKYSTDVPEINVKVEVAGQNIEVSVSDNGIGIPHTEKSKITGQFYRIGNEETRKTKGTGLGLYIVSRIVSAHQGKMTISDNVEKGSVFNVSFPIKQA